MVAPIYFSLSAYRNFYNDEGLTSLKNAIFSAVLFPAAGGTRAFAQHLHILNAAHTKLFLSTEKKISARFSKKGASEDIYIWGKGVSALNV